MSSISSATTSTTTSVSKVYSPLDTNEDGVVSAGELAAAFGDRSPNGSGSETELPTTSAAGTVTAQTASAILGVGASDRTDPLATSLRNAISAYSGNEDI